MIFKNDLCFLSSSSPLSFIVWTFSFLSCLAQFWTNPRQPSLVWGCHLEGHSDQLVPRPYNRSTGPPSHRVDSLALGCRKEWRLETHFCVFFEMPSSACSCLWFSGSGIIMNPSASPLFFLARCLITWGVFRWLFFFFPLSVWVLEFMGKSSHLLFRSHLFFCFFFKVFISIQLVCFYGEI